MYRLWRCQVSNKRIQKKQEKRAWERDRGKIIAEFLVRTYPGRSRGWYVRWAKPLLQMEKGPLLEYLMRETLLRLPFRHMLPRKTWDVPVVDWRPVVGYRPTISDVREKT